MDLTGKVCLITGATSGIGKETAIGIAGMGASLILPCRDMQKGELVKKTILRHTGNSRIDLMHCDLNSFSSIARFCDSVKSRYDKLDILINNAGIWSGDFSLSEDGIEQTFAVNHLAPFLMTNLLLESLKKSRNARIITVSSSMHFKGKMNFDDLEGRVKFDHAKAYGQSKLANVLFTRYLSGMLKGKGITANSLMPGVVKTDLFENFNPLMKFLIKLIWISPQRGAETTVYLASSPEVENITGEYFEKKKVKNSSRESKDPSVAKKLWNISVEYVGKYLDKPI